MRKILAVGFCALGLAIVMGGRAFAAAGNIIETARDQFNNNELYVYSQAGTQLSKIAIPNSPKGYDQPHDLVVDAAGNVQVVYGGPYLATYNGSSWTFHTALNYSLFGVTYTGAVATYGNYVYVQSQSTAASGNGIIRFDESNNYSFSETQLALPAGGDAEPQDVTMGMDGKLYVDYFIGGAAGNEIVAYDPNTMGVLKSFTMPTGNKNGDHVVADAAGDVFVSGDDALDKYSASGTFITSIPFTGKGDLTISSDGKILTTQNATAYVFDTNLNLLSSAAIQGANWGEPFVAWDGYQVPQVAAAPEAGTLGVLAVGVVAFLRRRK